MGAIAAWHYAALDLTMSHYDARGHVMVARRVLDNLTPGWSQFGAVWLPLPHILNFLPVQWDWNYQTGASGVIWSNLFMAAGLVALARVVATHVGSAVAGAAVAAAVLLNPNVLYLQSTPMTEPLLFGLVFVAWYAVDRFIETPGSLTARYAGWALAALVLTRYEGWCIGAGLCALGMVARPRQAWPLAAWPAAAILAFMLHSYGSTGVWFTTGGFYEPNNPAYGDPVLAWQQIVTAARRLARPAIVTLGGLGTLAILAASVVAARQGVAQACRALLPLTLFAASALPLYAFTSGHPVRVRYMISLVVACTVAAVWLVRWLPPRARGVVAAAGAAWVIVGAPMFDPEAPMVREAQWERPYSQARRTITAALVDVWDGTPVLASMGSLGHYMQQMSIAGFALKDFIHEGTGGLWHSAIIDPSLYTRWILIEESAEGGDQLAQRARQSPAFLRAYDRIAEAGGVALYRRR